MLRSVPPFSDGRRSAGLSAQTALKEEEAVRITKLLSATAVVACTWVDGVSAQCTGLQLLFSGQQGIIVDQFALPDYGQDCVLRAFDTTPPPVMNGDSALQGTFCAVGNGGFAHPLRANICDNGMATGSYKLGNGMAEASLTSPFGDVTVKAHGEPTPPECPELNGLGTTAGQPTLPIDLISAVACQEGEKIGSVVLCDSNGPAFKAEAENLTTVIKRWVPTPNLGIDFLCQNARMRGESGAPIIVNLCLPLRDDGTADFGPEGTSAVRFPLNNLPACSNRAAAPTLSEWGLIAAALGLLVLGTLILRWRERVAPALPVP